jgi:BirA family biotin operon repressor/biotin-[acetyl-CoA-carboxylase] ligase
MKGQLLKILREKQQIVSGEVLSAALGISRVAIWKHIRKLQELGYHIVSTPKGYRLNNSPDALFSWEFPGRESKIHYLPVVTSTMDVARDLARSGCPHFTTVIAGRQEKGRGRLKRNWLSPEGGLYVTLVLRPPIPPVLSARINFAVSLALALTLRKRFNIDAKVKWPNDLLVDNRKIAGILSEMEAEADRITFINVGIGLNVNNDPPLGKPPACSLKELLGKKISRNKLLVEFLDTLENKIHNEALTNVISEWKTYTLTLNRTVRIVTTHEITEGLALDVDENGSLVIELADGSIKKISHGDCFHT